MADAIEAMRSLRREIESRLAANPDYRALIALDRAIREASGHRVIGGSRYYGGGGARPVEHRLPNNLTMMSAEEHKMTERLIETDLAAASAQTHGRVSQADAAFQVLKLVGRPMTTAELIEPVRQQGATLGGDDPAVNLSSSLSRDNERFISVRWNRRPRWWFKDAEIPAEDVDSVIADLLGEPEVDSDDAASKEAT
ncbi:MAG: winged helix-turn-helix domain-containing protein [Brevundimonas sp.]|nr:winged helix-turn-helix domain-containing protein [Brevundimonas sp.]